MNALLKQAQKMQEQLLAARAEAETQEVEGQAGGGMVKVRMSGKHEVRRVQIERELLTGDPEMLEDLIAAATNDAVNRVAEATQQHMAGVSAGMSLPPGFKLPF
jgi:DNA-binding YbaB/EbfC family protein